MSPALGAQASRRHLAQDLHSKQEPAAPLPERSLPSAPVPEGSKHPPRGPEEGQEGLSRKQKRVSGSTAWEEREEGSRSVAWPHPLPSGQRRPRARSSMGGSVPVVSALPAPTSASAHNINEEEVGRGEPQKRSHFPRPLPPAALVHPPCPGRV